MNRIKNILTALALAVSSVAWLPAIMVKAVANTCTWTGGGSDSNISTAANWDTDCGGAPSPSDTLTLIFPANTSVKYATNDILTNVESIQLPGTTGAQSAFTISGNAITIGAGGILVEKNRDLELPSLTLGANTTFTFEYAIASNIVEGNSSLDFTNKTLNLNGHDLNITTKNYTALSAKDLPLSYAVYVPKINLNNSPIVGAGTTKINIYGMEVSTNTANPDLASEITLNDAILKATSSGNFGTSKLVSNNSQIGLSDTSSTTTKTLANQITFNGNLYGASFDTNYAIGQASFSTLGAYDVTFSGTVVFSKDTLINITDVSDTARTISFTGTLSGTGIPSLDAFNDSYKIVINSSANTSVVVNGTYLSVPSGSNKEITNDSSSFNYNTQGISVLKVTGKTGNVIVGTGSVLKGNGTVGNILVQAAATLAPGLSPGILNSGNLTLSPDATYQFEVGGANAGTGYDQMNVTGTVNVTNAILDVVLYNSYKPVSGAVYKIINNDSNDAVTGTFKGLAEGATFTKDNVTYKVSYVGGDGNDVILTVTKAPGSPDTGTFRAQYTSAVVFGGLSIAAGVYLLGGKKLKLPRRRK